MNNSKEIDTKITTLEVLPLVKVLFLLFIKIKPGITGYKLMNEVQELAESEIELKSGTTYTELKRLEKDYLVTSQVSQKGRKKRMYFITKSGQKELQNLISLINYRIQHLLIPIVELYNEHVKIGDPKK